MRPSTLAPLVALSLACASQPAGFTVTTRTQVELAGGAASPSRQTLTLSPPTLDRLDVATIAVALEGHGRWEESVAYGRVWVPFESLAGGFVPYLTRGEWVATRDGWYWQSGYAWGQIPFHYGRWAEVGGVWAWAPGTAFAPAWVDWRAGNSWIGWSPLAPLGADFAAPFTYCAGASLAGSGLQARAVTGPAAVSLYGATAALGGSAWPPLPAVVTNVASLWAQPLTPTPLAPAAIDLARRPPASAPPDTIDAVPCARANALARAAPVESSAGGRSVGVIRDGDRGATLVLAGGLPRATSGYSTIPANHETPAPRRTPSRPAWVARAPSAPGWDRSVASPPAAVDPSMVPAAVPGDGAWGSPRTLSAWAPRAAPTPPLRMSASLTSGFVAAPAAPPAATVPVPMNMVVAGGGAPAASGQGAPVGPLTLR